MQQEKPTTTVSSETNHSLVIKNNELQEANVKEKGRNAAITIGALFASIALNVFLAWLGFIHFPVDQYVPSANAAALCTVFPNDKPRITKATAADFAQDAVIGIYSYTFQNYRTASKEVADKYFTEEFRDSYLVAFGDSSNLQMVIANFYQVFASAAGYPPIVKEVGVTAKGNYYWDVQVVSNVYYTSGRKVIPEKIKAFVRVEQVDATRTAPRGIKISKVRTEAYSG